MNNIVSLENNRFPMTIVTNMNTDVSVSGFLVTDKSNTYNNLPNSVYTVGLMGYHKVKINRVEVLDSDGTLNPNPMLLSLISPVFQQRFGQYPYPLFSVNSNYKSDSSNHELVRQTTSLGTDSYYVYNFNNDFPLYVNNIYPDYIGSAHTFYSTTVTNSYSPSVFIISMEVEKL